MSGEVRHGVEDAVARIAEGGIVIVVDDHDRENEGDLIMAADAATPEAVSFFLEHTSGVICAALDASGCDALRLPPMVEHNAESNGTAFTVSVDAREGVTTGISASDRARTFRVLADAGSTASDLVRPGHVFPLRVRDGGVLKRAGHTEAAYDLARLAGRAPVGVLCEIVSPDRSRMANRAELEQLARDHDLPLISVADLVRHRLRGERLVRLTGEARMPTRHGEFTCQAWESLVDGTEHVALIYGDPCAADATLVRVHSECVTGDTFGSARCDCGTQLEDSIEAIARAGAGVVVYLRGHEGRGIGLAHKLAAYNLQDAGHDTLEANVLLGLPVDSREYGIGAQILVELGVRRLRLITNNPAKRHGLEGYDLTIVERVALPPRTTRDNVQYLRTKRERMGHLIPERDAAGARWGSLPDA